MADDRKKYQLPEPDDPDKEGTMKESRKRLQSLLEEIDRSDTAPRRQDGGSPEEAVKKTHRPFEKHMPDEEDELPKRAPREQSMGTTILHRKPHYGGAPDSDRFTNRNY